MRYGKSLKSDEALRTEELAVLAKALVFANRDLDDDVAGWPERAYKALGVLPPGTRYCIDDRGAVFPRRRTSETRPRPLPSNAQTLRQWQGALRRLLEDIVLDNGAIHVLHAPHRGALLVSPPAALGATSKMTRRIPFHPEVWTREIVFPIDTRPTSQRLVTPTLDAFVSYVAVLLGSRRWRTRAKKCEQCGKFFLGAKQRGRPTRTCGAECRTLRKDPTNADRQRRFRQQAEKSLRKGAGRRP